MKIKQRISIFSYFDAVKTRTNIIEVFQECKVLRMVELVNKFLLIILLNDYSWEIIKKKKKREKSFCGYSSMKTLHM